MHSSAETSLFTSDYQRIYANGAAINRISLYELKHAQLLSIEASIISFSTFLDNLEDAIIYLLLTRAQREKPKTPWKIVEDKTRKHFSALVSMACSKISVDGPSENIAPQEVIVFKSLSAISCNLKGHQIENITIDVDLLNSQDKIRLPVHHCKDCGRIFIGNETLKVYENIWGKMLICTRKDQAAEHEYDFYQTESPLHRLGYNVIAGNLTEKERRSLLVKIYENHWLSLFEIQRDIENAIRIFNYRIRFAEAVKKWKEDLYFISEYSKKKKI